MVVQSRHGRTDGWTDGQAERQRDRQIWPELCQKCAVRVEGKRSHNHIWGIFQTGAVNQQPDIKQAVFAPTISDTVKPALRIKSSSINVSLMWLCRHALPRMTRLMTPHPSLGGFVLTKPETLCDKWGVSG